MPTVPQYGGPKVQESAGPANLGQITARPDADTFNAGPSIDKVTSAASALYDKVRNDADQVAVMSAESKLTAFQTKALYDPKTGALNKRGKDAFNAPNEVNDQLDEQLSEIESGLTTNAQKAAFRAKAEAAKQSINRTLDQHVSSEIVKYDNDQTESYLTSQRNLAIANPYDAQTIQASKEAQANALYQFAERNGKPPEWAKEKIQAAESATNMSVLQEQLAKGDDITAEAYFKQHEETFQGQDRIQATKMVEESSTLGKAMRKADESVQQGMNLSQMMAQARTIENPKERKAYEDRAQHLYSQQKMAQQDFREKVNIQAGNFIDGGGSWQDYAKQNARTWAALPEADKNHIMSYRQGGATETDWTKYYDLKTLAATNPAEFNKVDLTKTYGYLADAQKKEFIELQTNTRGGKKAGLDGFQADSAIVNAALAGMGVELRADKMNKDDVQKATAFRRSVDEQIIAWEEANGKKPNNNEIRKIVDSLSTEAVVGKKWFGFANDTRRVFELDDETKPTFNTSDIPKAERKKIDDTLRRLGIPQTDSNALELWVKKLSKDSGKKIGAN